MHRPIHRGLWKVIIFLFNIILISLMESISPGNKPFCCCNGVPRVREVRDFGSTCLPSWTLAFRFAAVDPKSPRSLAAHLSVRGDTSKNCPTVGETVIPRGDETPTDNVTIRTQTSQSVTIENLEIRCEELQKKIDDLIEQLRQHAASPSRNNAQQQHQQQQLHQPQSADWETSDTHGGSEKQVRIVGVFYVTSFFAPSESSGRD